jgi:hypothetical protein
MWQGHISEYEQRFTSQNPSLQVIDIEENIRRACKPDAVDALAQMVRYSSTEGLMAYITIPAER